MATKKRGKIQKSIILGTIFLAGGMCLFSIPVLAVPMIIIGIIFLLKPKIMSTEKAAALQATLRGAIDFRIKRNHPKNGEFYTSEAITMIDAKETGLSPSLDFLMSYTDTNGKSTTRKISLKSLEMNEGKLYLNAFCHLRNEDRMFLTERIKTITYNKEAIPSPVDFFYNIFLSSGPYKLHEFISAHEATFNLLAFLARADGKMAKVEKEILTAFIQKHVPEVSTETVAEELKYAGDITIPQFYNVLKLVKDETLALKADITEYASRLIQAKKTPDAIEKAIFEKINTTLAP
jgi:hypothetical protein